MSSACAVKDFEHAGKILLPTDGCIIIEEDTIDNWLEFATQDRIDDDGDGEFSVIRKHYSFLCSDKQCLQEFFKGNKNLLDKGRLLYKPQIKIERHFERFPSLPDIGKKQKSHFEIEIPQKTLHAGINNMSDVLCRLEIPYFENVKLSELDTVINKYPLASKQFGEKLRSILDKLGESIIGSDGNSSMLIRKVQDELQAEMVNLKKEYKELNRNLLIDSAKVSLCMVAFTVVGFVTGEINNALKMILSGGITGKYANLFSEYMKKRLKLKDNDFHFLLLISKK